MRCSPRALALAGALSLSLTAASLPAQAEPTSTEKKAAAQALFDEARALSTASKYAEACPKFIESERLDPTMGTKFYLADCLEHIGRFASAWTYYLEVTDAARAAGLKDREAFARDRAAALQPKLARLTVSVAEATRAVPGLAVRRDGLAISEALWGTAVPVDPGEHVVSAEATGKAPWERRIELKDPGQTVTVEVPALENSKPVAATPAPAPPAPALVTPPPPPSRAGGSGQRAAGIAVGALGIVGLSVSAVAGGIALRNKAASNADNHCDAGNFCDDQGLALRREGITAATVSTIGVILGGVALAGGAALLFTAPRASASSSGASTALAVGPGWLAVRGLW